MIDYTVPNPPSDFVTIHESPVQPFQYFVDSGNDPIEIKWSGTAGGTVNDGPNLPPGVSATSSGPNEVLLTGPGSEITSLLQSFTITPYGPGEDQFHLLDYVTPNSYTEYVSTVFDYSSPPPPPPLPPSPHITGTVSGQTTTSEIPITPFAHVSINDPTGASDTLEVINNGSGTLSGVGLALVPGENNSYLLSGTPAVVTSELNALVFTPSAGAPGTSSTTTFILNLIDGGSDNTTSVINSDPAVSQSPPQSPLSVEDTSTNQALNPSIQPYSGPVANLQQEYINTGADSLNISATTPNWFIHSGNGNDAIAVSSGTNVLDGGAGSNFLTGGSGADTFFVDDRGPTADIWSTVNNFHAGDAATIWGVTPQDHSLNWIDGQGAVGYTGLTLHATASGAPTASLTLVGFTQSDLNNGKLSVSFGSSNGSSYMYVHDNS